MRICRGVYMRPVETCFGPCAPSVEKAIVSLSTLWGEAIDSPKMATSPVTSAPLPPDLVTDAGEEALEGKAT